MGYAALENTVNKINTRPLYYSNTFKTYLICRVVFELINNIFT